MPSGSKRAVFTSCSQRGAGDAAAQQAGRHVHQVVVLERRAHVAAERQVLQAPVELLAGERRAEPEAVVARQADAVRDEVARRRAQRGHVVVHAEVGQVVAHGLVPVELALADQRAQRADRELLGDGGDRHQRVRRHRQVLVAVAQAVALQQHDLVAHHDADGGAGDLLVGERFLDERVERCERLGRAGAAAVPRRRATASVRASGGGAIGRRMGTLLCADGTGPYHARSMSAAEAVSRRERWLRPALWTALFRHAVPVLGVLFLDWQPLDVLLFLFVETWLFLTLRMGTEVVLNRSFGDVPTTAAGAVAQLVLCVPIAGLMIGFVMGLVGLVVQQVAFGADDWRAFAASRRLADAALPDGARARRRRADRRGGRLRRTPRTPAGARRRRTTGSSSAWCSGSCSWGRRGSPPGSPRPAPARAAS